MLKYLSLLAVLLLAVAAYFIESCSQYAKLAANGYHCGDKTG